MEKKRRQVLGTHLNEENIHFSLRRVFLVSNVSVAAVAAAATVYRLIMSIVFNPSCAKGGKNLVTLTVNDKLRSQKKKKKSAKVKEKGTQQKGNHLLFGQLCHHRFCRPIQKRLDVSRHPPFHLHLRMWQGSGGGCFFSITFSYNSCTYTYVGDCKGWIIFGVFNFTYFRVKAAVSGIN